MSWVGDFPRLDKFRTESIKSIDQQHPSKHEMFEKQFRKFERNRRKSNSPESDSHLIQFV